MGGEAKSKLAYSIKEAVEATGYSRSYLYIQIGEGKLVAYRRGGRVFITAENLQKMIDEDAKNVIEPLEYGCLT